MRILTAAAVAALFFPGDHSPYHWQRVTEAAAFPAAYNFPVAMVRGRAVAIHPEGIWSSADGASWRKEPLAPSGLNDAYLDHVVLRDTIYALGSISGNYLHFTLSNHIRRSGDLARWEDLGPSSTLPTRVFYSTVVFQDAIWLFGGWDGERYHHDAWRSTDAVHWERVAKRAPWSPRGNSTAVVFNGRMFLIGGGEIDGAIHDDVWSTTDGRTWTREAEHLAPEVAFGFSATVFDGRLWLLGANRNGEFKSELLVSSDGRRWTAMGAPWSPRGGVASWVMGDALYLTGGKYSYPERDGPRFVYSHDVWRMDRETRSTD